jgi:hypothetical protein
MAASAGDSSPIPNDRGHTVRRSGTRRRLAILAIIVVVILVVATLSAYEAYRPAQSSASPYPPPPAGWATFQTAWAGVAGAFAQLAHGQWTIIFAEGVAADGPWSPPATFWGGTAAGLWDPCAAQLSGISTITFWNASAYPYSTSPNVFSSGAAPLWTFIFNGTGTPTFVASWLAGQIVVNAALGPTSPCFLTSVFNSPSVEQVHPATEVDSNTIAAAANTESQLVLPVPPPHVPTLGEEAFALYFPGPERLLPSTTTGANLWSVAYGMCGLPGQLGSTFTLGTFLFNASTAQGNSWATTTVSCYDSYYLLNMTREMIHANSSGVYRQWSLNWSFLSSAVPPRWSLSELTTSFLQWQLRSSAPPFSLVPPSAAGSCPTDPVVWNCTPPAQGWYAVLLDPAGNLLDSYPTIANGTAWSVPNDHLSPGDQILFVGAPGILTNATFEVTYGGEPTVFGGEPL